MQTYEEQIGQLAEPLIAADGMEMVLVECLKMKAHWLVRVYIDKEGGVTVDDCAQVSDKLGDLLDVHDVPPGQYTLEISSPGLDRPLHRDKDFVRYCGSRIHVRLLEKLEGRRDLRGELVSYEDSDVAGKVIVMSVDGQTLRIPREKVVRANLEYTL
ncbi:MAG: ribosome maturation factor RimP [Syntrophales bacterium]|jgi:ribosome maturation factor RimP|nr:ribosome maturation factor RimP [Syntrophales bacterium]